MGEKKVTRTVIIGKSLRRYDIHPENMDPHLDAEIPVGVLEAYEEALSQYEAAMKAMEECITNAEDLKKPLNSKSAGNITYKDVSIIDYGKIMAHDLDAKSITVKDIEDSVKYFSKYKTPKKSLDFEVPNSFYEAGPKGIDDYTVKKPTQSVEEILAEELAAAKAGQAQWGSFSNHYLLGSLPHLYKGMISAGTYKASDFGSKFVYQTPTSNPTVWVGTPTNTTHSNVVFNDWHFNKGGGFVKADTSATPMQLAQINWLTNPPVSSYRIADWILGAYLMPLLKWLKSEDSHIPGLYFLMPSLEGYSFTPKGTKFVVQRDENGKVKLYRPPNDYLHKLDNKSYIDSGHQVTAFTDWLYYRLGFKESGVTAEDFSEKTVFSVQKSMASKQYLYWPPSNQPTPYSYKSVSSDSNYEYDYGSDFKTHVFKHKW